MTSRQKVTLAVALALVLVTHAAYAQIGGGGTGGLVQPILSWIVTNFVQAAIMLGILAVGAMLIAGRHTMVGVFTMIAGGLIMVNYQTISGLFGGN